MIITIHEPKPLTMGREQWHVWAQLEPGDPSEMGESFIIGLGDTRDEAIAMAVKDLEDTVDALQRPPT